MNADGSGQTRLTHSEVTGFSPNQFPSWSPDGRRIAYSSYRDYNVEIIVMNADGSEQTRLTENKAWDSHPSWSPDGRRIAISTDRDDPYPDDIFDIYSVYVINADGSGQTRLTDIETSDLDPSWSPDGRRIAFSSNRDDPDPTDYLDLFNIYVVNPDGSDAVRLTDSEAWDRSPSWSPDGSRIAFTSNRDDPYLYDDNYIEDIYVMNADGSGQTRLTDYKTWLGFLSWSPGGRRIAFSRFDGKHNGEIYVINADGSGLTRLTDDPLWDFNPSWSPEVTPGP